MRLNLDGVNFYKLAQIVKSFWPILCYLIFEGLNRSEMLIFGLWCGGYKPKSFKFLEQFLAEYNDLKDSYEFNGTKIELELQMVIMDMPAQSGVLCTLGHAAFNACHYCEVVAKKEGKYTKFPSYVGPLRTDEAFRNKEYLGIGEQSFQKGKIINSLIRNK